MVLMPWRLMTLLTIPIFCLIVLFEEYYRGYLFQLRYLRRLHAKNKVAERAIHDAEVLRVKNKEQEDVMALVAHKFRGSLDRIVYNTDHENSPWVHREAVNTMRGLLDIFGLISTNTALLRRKLQEDRAGDVDPGADPGPFPGAGPGATALACGGANASNSTSSPLPAGRGWCRPTTRLRDWHERHGDLAEQLRTDWESSLMERLPQADLPDLCDWIGERFFPLQVEGFGGSSIRFAPYGTTGVLSHHPADRGLHQPVQILRRRRPWRRASLVDHHCGPHCRIRRRKPDDTQRCGHGQGQRSRP